MQASDAIDTAPHTWHILGTGAMACLWACALDRGGYAVRLVSRHPPPRAAYHAVTLLTAAGEERHDVLLEGCEDAAAMTRLLVCTKAYDVEAAVRAQASRLLPGAAVVLLQNGVGFQESVRLTLPAARVFSAVTTEGAFLEAELCVRHAGRGHTQLGLHPRAEAATAAALATELSGGGLAVEPVADIEAALWRKLAVNCAINPLTALHGCRNGRLLEDCVLYAEFSALCTELETVFAGLGRGAIARTLRDQASAVARATANNRSSMLQDLEAHRETEIDFITGQLCRVARGAGIPCPRNESLLADVRRRARASA